MDTPTPTSERASEREDCRPPVVVVTGPTGSGKSALAIELAERFGGEILNADSMQVFRYLDIGTAKPSLADRARVPHHLFDVADPDEDYSAGRYAAEARAAAEQIHARDHVVFLTGGTGLYVRAFLDGLVQTGRADPALRRRLEQEQERAAAEGDATRLHRRLERTDPDAAGRIHPHDLRRTIRALEILEQAGRPASRVRAEHAFGDRPFRVLHLAIDPGRETLARWIAERCDRMIAAGLLREVRGLRERGYGPELRPMQAIGYRHMQAVVDGLDTLVNAAEAMKADTRRFARRQRTWLRALDDVRWLDPRHRAQVFEAVGAFLGREPAAAASSGSPEDVATLPATAE